MKVPFLDLQAHHAPIRDEIQTAINSVIESGAFAGGPFVEQFEKDFAAWTGAAHVIGVGSGTEALWLSLLALGVGHGDEVITVPMTFAATAEAICFTGARPVFVDIDPATYTMDPALLEAAITVRTRAIIPVHLFGQVADMGPICEIAKRHGLVVIEDACQAHGATNRGRQAGTIGQTGCFSFYPGKNLGAFGDAGAVVTNDAVVAQHMRELRDHGQVRKYEHTRVGWNCRMDGIQGAVLSVKLRRLSEGNRTRRAHAAAYSTGLAECAGITLPMERPESGHVWHVFAVQSEARDTLRAALEAKGIASGIHYPVPIHRTNAYAFLGYAPDTFPVAEKCARQFLSLPMFPELNQDQIKAVIEAVRCHMLRTRPAQCTQL